MFPKGARRDLLDEPAHQVTLVSEELANRQDGVLVLAVAVQGLGDAPRATQDLPRLARGQPGEGRAGLMEVLVAERDRSPPASTWQPAATPSVRQPFP